MPEQTAPLQLIGPPGLASYLGRLRALYGEWLEPVKRAVAVTEISPGDALVPRAGGDEPCEGTVAWRVAKQAPLAGPSIVAHAANHSETRFSAVNLCLRCRAAEGGVLAFSGDGEPGDGLLVAARDADLLVVECSTPDELRTAGHMTPRSVGELCREARPRRVVLTHIYPPADALDLPALVRRLFAGQVETGRDGGVYEVP